MKANLYTFTVTVQLKNGALASDVRTHIASAIRGYGERYTHKHPFFPKNILAVNLKEVKD